MEQPWDLNQHARRRRLTRIVKEARVGSGKYESSDGIISLWNVFVFIVIALNILHMYFVSCCWRPIHAHIAACKVFVAAYELLPRWIKCTGTMAACACLLSCSSCTCSHNYQINQSMIVVYSLQTIILAGVPMMMSPWLLCDDVMYVCINGKHNMGLHWSGAQKDKIIEFKPKRRN